MHTFILFKNLNVWLYISYKAVADLEAITTKRWSVLSKSQQWNFWQLALLHMVVLTCFLFLDQRLWRYLYWLHTLLLLNYLKTKKTTYHAVPVTKYRKVNEKWASIYYEHNHLSHFEMLCISFIAWFVNQHLPWILYVYIICQHVNHREVQNTRT